MTFLLKSSKSSEDTVQNKSESKVLAQRLSDLDLDTELLNQYKYAVDLLEEAKTDTTVPLNQKAQAVNSVTSIIQSIVKTRLEVQNIESLKLIEVILIDTLQKFPEIRDRFLAEYEKALKDKVRT